SGRTNATDVREDAAFTLSQQRIWSFLIEAVGSTKVSSRHGDQRLEPVFLVNAHDAVVQAVADVNVFVARAGRNRPTERDLRPGLLAAGALTIEVAIGAERDNLVIGVIANGDRVGDGIGDVEPAEAIDVEAWLCASTGADRAPAAYGPTARIACDRSLHALDGPILDFDLASLRRALLNGATRAPLRP